MSKRVVTKGSARRSRMGRRTLSEATAAGSIHSSSISPLNHARMNPCPSLSATSSVLSSRR